LHFVVQVEIELLAGMTLCAEHQPEALPPRRTPVQHSPCQPDILPHFGAAR
jgi:hypothetical protein